jgi:hypothetical protein
VGDVVVEPLPLIEPVGVRFEDGLSPGSRCREHLLTGEWVDSALLAVVKASIVERYWAWLVEYCAARAAAVIEWRVGPEIAVQTKARKSRVRIYSRFATLTASSA